MRRAAGGPLTRQVTGLLLAVFFARGVVLACVLPPGEMWDEYSHLAHVDQWAVTGRPAEYATTTVDPAFLAAMARLPQPPPAAFARTYGPFWTGAAAPPIPPKLGLYEAQHPFLYYALAAPVYRACGGRADLPAAVDALRLINLACGTAALALVLGWLGRNVAPAAAVVLGCWVAFQPLLLLNVVRVANDGPAFLFGTAVVVAAFDLRRRFWVHAIAVAVLLPVAILFKVTNAALLPVVVLLMGIAVAGRTVRPAAAAAALILIGTVTAAALWPSLASNMDRFGLPTPMQEAIANRDAGRSAWAVLTAAPPRLWPVWATSWWVTNGLWVGGWSFLRPPRAYVIAYAAAVAVAGSAVVVRWRSLPLSAAARWSAVAVVGCVHVGLMVHATESFAAWGGRVFTNPWYAAVAVPWWLVLLGCGGLSLPWPAARRGLMLGVPVLFVTTEAIGVFGRMLPAYYGPGWGSMPTRMGTLHSVATGPATLATAAVLTAVLTVLIARAAAAVTADGKISFALTPASRQTLPPSVHSRLGTGTEIPPPRRSGQGKTG